MATPQASSRLELLQARFQQKQLQEKEQKLLQLYDQQQQRAYQVVQRSSASSNGSNHGSSISHHTVTKTTTTSHTTSTSQGGKVRQMFDERRQTTVKGIDRSYPLEPLENKPRKQTNGNVAQKNGNLTVNRQSVTVKRVARADVNSNLNGGKPIVSYHEEITSDSYGPDGRPQPDDDEFGNENHINQYGNGNQTYDEEVLDEDTIERNRMMAKLHLMEYDETLKHRVKNDLESEQFPEDFMVEVPDKLPKRNVTKKLSPAEARLERFKNTNAKRSNSIAKNSSTVLKKRSDPILPAKSTSSEDEGKTRIRVILDRGSRSGSPRMIETNVIRNVEDVSPSSDSGKNPRRKNENFRSFCKKTEKLMGLKVDEEHEDKTRRSGSPKFFCKESEKSATTYAIDSKARDKLSPEFARNVQRRSESPKYDSKSGRRLSNQLSKDRIKRSESPQFFCTESEKSATTYAIDSKTREKLSPDFSKNTLRKRESPGFLDSKISRKSSAQLSGDKTRRSESPKFFYKEPEKSATTYAIDSRSRSTSPDFIKIEPRRVESVPIKSNFETKNKSVDIDVVDRKLIPRKHEKMIRTSARNDHKTGTEMDSKSTRNKMPNVFERLTRGRSSSPKFLQTTTSATKDSKLTSNSPDIFHKLLPKRNKDSETIRTTKSKSPNLTKKLGRSGTSPQFFISDSERSATIMLVTPETILKEKPESLKSVRREEDSKSYTSNSIVGEPRRRTSEEIVDARSKHSIRSSVSRFFAEQCEKTSRNLEGNVQSTETDENLRWSRDSSPLSLKDTRTPSPKSPQFSRVKTGKSVSTTTIDGSRDWSLKSRKNSRNASPKSSKPKSTEDVLIKRSGPRDTREIVKTSKSKSPDFKVSSLQSTRLIRDAIKRQNNKDRGRCDSRGSRRNSRVSSDTEGTHEAFDEEVDELPATGSSPKSCTSVEVDAEILEITMPDQYTEHRPLRGDKTREGSSTERLFTYSVCEPGSERGSLFELSKGDQGKTDRWEASGRKERAGRNAKSIPSPTNSLDVRGSKLRTRENRKSTETEDLREKRSLNEYENLKGTKESVSRSTSPASHLIICDSKRQKEENRKINRKSGAEALGSRVDGILGKYDNLKSLKGCVSRSSSPANSLIVCDLKGQREEDRRIGTEALRSREKRILDEYSQEKYDNFKQTKRNKSNGPFPTKNQIIRGSKSVAKVDDKPKCLQKTILNESNKEERPKRIRKTCNDSTIPNSKRRITVSTNRRNEIRNLREKTPSPVQTKQKKGSSRSPQILRSMKLVQSAIKGKSFEQEEKSREIIGETRTFQTKVNKSDSVEPRKSNSTIVYIKDESSSSKNYERTDSVESALKRFDSIGTESVRSATEKNRTFEESKTISLKALDRIDADLLKMNKNESKLQERFARTRDSIDITRISSTGSKSPVCKRKLFQDVDSGDETETGSSKSRYSSNSRTISRKTSKKSNSKRYEDEEIDEASTDTSLSVSVKQLRSIEDIRKSIDAYSDTKGTSTKSAIANNTLKRSNETQSRPTNPDDRAGSRKEISGNLTAKNHALGDAERSSIKCAMRFFRVTKSPSPDSTKTTEPGNRARRNVLSSPSKSPDTVARRPSTEMKAHEAKTLKRPTLVKGTEPIGNRKTTTATSTRKSTDVVDGAILENGVHLRDQTAETKYDNDPIEAKKSDAFVIEFDEQSPKENDAPIPRKSLLRKQSIDKQTPSVQSGRPPSSVSSTSNGSSMQGQVSGSKGKMASKARTPSSGVTHRGSTSSKSGGIANVVDKLIPCKMCGRRFAEDRVTLHEQICTKTTQKKRKQFDTTLYRVKGTDLEPFVRKGLSRKLPEKSKKPEQKSNWRRKHEDFINAIRSAKKVQAHLAAGGKLSDLPPPPPCDTSDYIQCPHCGRKFNQSAAERHIPKCENMLHNKPIHSRAPKPKR